MNNTTDLELERIRQEYQLFMEEHLAEMQASSARLERRLRVYERWSLTACIIVWAVAAVDFTIAIRKWFFT